MKQSQHPHPAKDKKEKAQRHKDELNKGRHKRVNHCKSAVEQKLSSHDQEPLSVLHLSKDHHLVKDENIKLRHASYPAKDKKEKVKRDNNRFNEGQHKQVNHCKSAVEQKLSSHDQEPLSVLHLSKDHHLVKDENIKLRHASYPAKDKKEKVKRDKGRHCRTVVEQELSYPYPDLLRLVPTRDGGDHPGSGSLTKTCSHPPLQEEVRFYFNIHL